MCSMVEAEIIDGVPLDAPGYRWMFDVAIAAIMYLW